MTTTISRTELAKAVASMTLPALPRTAIQLLQLSKNEDAGPPEYAAVIETDPGLTVQVLKFVNSSYFGFSRKISSVRHGLALVGVRAVKNFVLWNAVVGLIPRPKCGPFDLSALWADSLRRAIFARKLAVQWGLPEREDVFTAALLQDVAVPLLAADQPTIYSSLLDRRKTDGLRLSHLESEHFGWQHADAAGEMVRRWQMPPEFAGLIERHLDLDTLMVGETTARPHLAVALSSLLPSGTDDRWIDREQLLDSLKTLDPPSASGFGTLCQSVEAEFTQFAPSMNLAPPKRSLTDLVK